MIKFRLEILFQRVIVFVGLMVVYLLVMGGSHMIVVFKEVIFIMIPILF